MQLQTRIFIYSDYGQSHVDEGSAVENTLNTLVFLMQAHKDFLLLLHV
jgi:hypothetical protein